MISGIYLTDQARSQLVLGKFDDVEKLDIEQPKSCLFLQARLDASKPEHVDLVPQLVEVCVLPSLVAFHGRQEPRVVLLTHVVPPRSLPRSWPSSLSRTPRL